MNDAFGTTAFARAASVAGSLVDGLLGRRAPLLRTPGDGPDGGSWHLGSNVQGREAWLSDRDVAGNLLVTGSEGPGHTGLLIGLVAQAMARGLATVHVCADNVDEAVSMTVGAASATGRSDDLVVLDWRNPYTEAVAADLAKLLEDAAAWADPVDLVRRAGFAPPQPCMNTPRDLVAYVVRAAGSPWDHPVPARKPPVATQAKDSFRDALAGARVTFLAVPHHCVSNGEMLGKLALECLDATLRHMPPVPGPTPRGLVVVDCKDHGCLHDLPGFVERTNRAGFAVVMAMRSPFCVPELRRLWRDGHEGGRDGLRSAFPTWVRVGTNLASWAEVTVQAHVGRDPPGEPRSRFPDVGNRFRPLAGIDRDAPSREIRA